MVELLVAMAITSVLMVVLFSLVGQSTAGYTQTQRAVNTISQARAFIQFFGRELSTRLPDTPMIHETGSGSGVEASEKIAFVRAISIDEQQSATPGDLNLVYYYIAFSADGANAESPKLFRGTLNPADTQTVLSNPGTPSFPTANPAIEEPIVPNVLNFTAKPRYYSGSPPALTDWTASSPERPSVIELTIKFIDDSSAQRFKTRAEWNRLADTPRDSEIQLIRSFTHSIAIAK
jgi:type II secretory pathway pseudopilin PulG